MATNKGIELRHLHLVSIIGLRVNHMILGEIPCSDGS
jgi:hypothetical protein